VFGMIGGVGQRTWRGTHMPRVAYYVEPDSDCARTAFGTERVAGDRPILVHDCRRLEHLLEGSAAWDCVVVQVEALGGTIYEWLRGRPQPLHHVPVLLVIPFTPDNARSLGGIHVDSVVWLHEGRGRVAMAVEEAVAAGPLRALARTLQARSDLPRTVRTALSKAVLNLGSVQTANDLARLAHCERATLYRHWRGVSPSPKVCIDWLTILHAFRIKSPRRSWAAVAAEIEMEEQSLRRVVKRCLGICPRQLPQYGLQRVTTRFLANLAFNHR
jgi:hypothetical protein